MTEMICGYEVISRIAAGPRSEVLLARAPADLDSGPARKRSVGIEEGSSGLSPGEEVVLKVLGARYGEDDEVVALDSVESDHIVRLRDLATLGDGRVLLVLERLQAVSLGDLLLDRGRIEPGEAVTVLVSVLRGLDDLHAAGWVHGAVGAANILFRADGTPVLVGLGSSRPRDAGGVLMDRSAVARLVDALIPELSVGELARLTSPAVALAELEDMLFDVAPAEPVRLDPRAAGRGPADRGPRHRRRVEAATTRIPGRGIAVQAPDHGDAALSGTHGRRWPWQARARDSGSASTVSRAASPHVRGAAPAVAASVAAGPALARILAAVRSIRPRFWALGAGGAVALLVALVAVPVDAPASGVVDAPGPSPTSVRLAAADAAIVAALVGDDPAAAALALLDRRAQCFDQSAPECIAEIAQSGSAFEVGDLAALEEERDPAPIVADGEPRVQRMGDAALVTFASTALLLVRTDAGWRLRDQFTASG